VGRQSRFGKRHINLLVACRVSELHRWAKPQIMKTRAVGVVAISIAFIVVGQAGADECAPKLGDQLAAHESTQMLMISSGQMSPSAEVRCDHITYAIAVDPSDSVIFVSTSSSAFVTPEGLSTASTLEDVLAASAAQVVEERGWGHYVRLPSGWCAGFFIWKEDGPRGAGFVAPHGSSRVDSFFQRGSRKEKKTAQPGATDNPEGA